MNSNTSLVPSGVQVGESDLPSNVSLMGGRPSRSYTQMSLSTESAKRPPSGEIRGFAGFSSGLPTRRSSSCPSRPTHTGKASFPTVRGGHIDERAVVRDRKP